MMKSSFMNRIEALKIYIRKTLERSKRVIIDYSDVMRMFNCGSSVAYAVLKQAVRDLENEFEVTVNRGFIVFERREDAHKV